MFRGRKEEQEFTEEENKSNPLRELAGMLVYIIIVLSVTAIFSGRSPASRNASSLARQRFS